MAYQNNIPLAGDLISKSQADINGNFQALNNMYIGINNYIMFPEQAAAPAVAATNLALYTKHVGALTAMFIKDSAGIETDFTTAKKAAAGECRLPCGIAMKWGSSAFPGGTHLKAVTFIGAALTNFTTCYAVFTSVYGDVLGDARDYVLNVTAKNANGFTVERTAAYSGTNAEFYWFAIGV